MTLPHLLLHAISSTPGGRVALVIGAGCSVEPPTSLRMSRACSAEAFRLLVLDGILDPADCADPEDLSAVTDCVIEKLGDQTELVRRLPTQDFRHAEPNAGHLLAAAMLVEGALSAVLTLNFDLAMSTALTAVSARGQVAVIAGPEQHTNVSGHDLIYLHRNVDADWRHWILSTHELEEGWKDGWEAVMATRVLSTPFVVFAGLGSPARVLLESARRLKSVIPDGIEVYQVDPGERAASLFANELEVTDDHYLQMGWGAFTEQLASRLTAEHVSALREACLALQAREGWEAEDCGDLCERLGQLGLVLLGSVRARWLLSDRTYCAKDSVNPELLADLILAIRLVERVSGTQAVISDNGVVELRQGAHTLASLLIASGGGTHRWLALEGAILRQEGRWRRHSPSPAIALVSGYIGSPQGETAAPVSIVSEGPNESIVGGETALRLVSADDLRARHDLVTGIFAA